MANNLMLHTGAKETTLDDIRAVKTPPAADGWQPIPHYDLIETTRKQMADLGFMVKAERHGLYKEGDRYFGILDLVGPGGATSDHALVAGLRNSHDKSFAAGLVLGSRVFVCDNLAFSGEVKFQRRHTVHISRDLPGVVARAVGRLTMLHERQEVRIDAYKTHSPASRLTVHDTLVRTLDLGIVAGSALPKVLAEWRQPAHEYEAPTSYWGLYNAITWVLKDLQPTEIAYRSEKLTALFDSLVNLPEVGPLDVVEEDAIEGEAVVS